MKSSDFSTAAPVDTLPPEHFASGKTATEFDPGDFILVKGKGLQGWLIRFGQKMRMRGADRKYVDWAHAALIVDRAGTLIEAKYFDPAQRPYVAVSGSSSRTSLPPNGAEVPAVIFLTS